LASYAVVGAALSVPLPGAPLTFISDSTALSLSRSPRALASYAVVGAALSVPLPGVALTNARSPPNSNFNHLNLTNKNPFSASNEKKVVVVIVAVILLLLVPMLLLLLSRLRLLLLMVLLLFKTIKFYSRFIHDCESSVENVEAASCSYNSSM